MKQKYNILPLQKVLTLVMAAMVLLLTMFNSNSRRESQRADGLEKEAFVASTSIQSVLKFPSSSGPLPKVSLILFALASLWSLLMFLKGIEVQENQTLLKGFFLQKIQFIFVSTKAP